MKSFPIPWIALVLRAVLTPIASAQSYAIEWSTIASGGGSSTGSVYSVSGTIGQPAADAMPMTGGNYSLMGGFWTFDAVQTEGAPQLAISLTNRAVTVSWSSASTNWMLQQNADLKSTNWITVPEAIMGDGTLKFIIANPPEGDRFYRLREIP